MNWSGLKATISPLAPLLGSALGGPAGGLVGSLVATLFGTSPTDEAALIARIQADPEAALKLKQLETDVSLELRKLDSQDFQTSVEDTKSARDLAKSYVQQGQTDWFMIGMGVLLTILYIVVTVGALYMCAKGTMDSTESVFIGTVVGSLNAHFGRLVSFLFGSGQITRMMGK